MKSFDSLPDNPTELKRIIVDLSLRPLP